MVRGSALHFSYRVQLQHVGVAGSLWRRRELGFSDTVDAEGKRSDLIVVLVLGLFSVAVSRVGTRACAVGCARQAVNIVLAFL